MSQVIEEEIKNRIALGNKAYYANATIFKNRLKLKIYHSIIRPIVTYSCETWVFKESDKQKLLIFERKILRRIYGAIKISNNEWRIRTNDEINKIIKNRIVNFIQAQRISWFGHINRMPDESLVKRIYKWQPIGARPRVTRWSYMERRTYETKKAGLKQDILKL
ncbi:hypothetical protein C0J52_21495 [Blattella germanica]|nr:hypothetical protein C0J52_21495 [Blattella germanica]